MTEERYKRRRYPSENKVIQYLDGYLDNLAEVESLIRTRDRLVATINRAQDAFERATRATSAMTATRVSGTTAHDSMANAVCDMIRYKDYAKQHANDPGKIDEVLSKRISELAEELENRLNAINGVNNDQYRSVLIHRYIEGCSWEYMAQKMHYERSRLNEIHGEALKKVVIKSQERTQADN